MRVRHINNHAQLIGPANKGAPQRRQATPFLPAKVCGAIGKLIVFRMHQADHTHARLVKRIQQVNIHTKRIGILNALINHPLTRRFNGRCVLGPQSQSKFIIVLAQQIINHRIAMPRMRQRLGKAARGQRPLRRIDDPKAAIQPALLHARQINLRIIPLPIMAFCNVKTLAVQHQRRIQMAVQHQKIKVRCGLVAGGKAQRTNNSHRKRRIIPRHNDFSL